MIPDFATQHRGERLALRGSRLGPAGASALAEYPELSAVTDLELRGARIGDEGLVALLASPRLGRLESLDLADNALTAVGLRALAASPAIAGLKVLDLGQNPLDADAIDALAAASPALAELSLTQAPIGDAGAAALARSTIRPTHLRLDLCGLTELGVRALVEAGALAEAASIGLGGDPIGDAGAAALSALAARPGTLDLSYTGLGPAGLSALLASEVLGECSYLSLIGDPLGAAGYERLLAHAGRLPERVLLPWVDAALAKALRARTRVVIPNTPLAPGLVFACPYCREVLELDAHVCPRCKAIATDDAGSEERPERLAAEPRVPCPHCGASMHHRACRCPGCASWTR